MSYSNEGNAPISDHIPLNTLAANNPSNHQTFLLEALKLAEERRGFCAPNPSVGAVLVKNGEIIGKGNHYAVGYDHAEVVACKNFADLQDATLYVTLEPCCHFGRTPPCTELIAEKKIGQVIYAFSDPNPQVAGMGERWLRDKGIACQKIELPEISRFYESYVHWTATKTPWVTSKLAISLDAKIADPQGNPIQITGNLARDYTHQCRLRADGILTSVKTILRDNPSLNVRLQGAPIPKQLFILDSRLELPPGAMVFSTAAKITVFHSSNDQHKIDLLEAKGVQCLRIDCDNGLLQLNEVITTIGRLGLHDLWIEAGGKVYSNILKQGLAQTSYLYIAPKLLGVNAVSAFEAEEDIFYHAVSKSWFQLGEDLVCAFRFYN